MPRPAAFSHQLREVVRRSAERHRRRAWHAVSHYSIFEGYGEVVDPDGSVVRILDPVPNALTNDGQASMLNVYLKASPTAFTTFYLGLFTAASGASAPAKTSSASNIINTGTATSTQPYEEAGGGYARQGIANANWGTPALNSGDQMSTASQQTFGPASGANWTGTTGTSAALTYAFVSSGASGTTGTLILFVALSAQTTIAIGQSFNYTLNFKQQ